MGEYDKKVKCELSNQMVNVEKKGMMSKCNRCYVNDCEAKDYPMKR